jgi:hypothetical protein
VYGTGIPQMPRPQVQQFVPMYVQAVQILLTGLDYGSYRNQRAARMDDQLIRETLAVKLNEASQAFTRRYKEWYRANLPMPTREQPYPPAEVMQLNRQALNIQKRISILRNSLITMPVPEADDFWNRYITVQQHAQQLTAYDIHLATAVLAVADIPHNPDYQEMCNSMENAFSMLEDEMGKRLTFMRSIG